MSIYPNPSNKEATVLLRSASETDRPIYLISSLGEVVAQSTMVMGHNQASINTSLLTEGIYIVQIPGGQKAHSVRKLLVVH